MRHNSSVQSMGDPMDSRHSKMNVEVWDGIHRHVVCCRDRGRSAKKDRGLKERFAEHNHRRLHLLSAAMFKKPLAEFKTSGMIQNRCSSLSFLTRFQHPYELLIAKSSGND